MMAETSAGAASRSEVEWHAINWQHVNQTVRRLQSRIVKATQAGRYGKVKALQRLLTHSFSGKALAVRRVTENQGKRTPGVDQVIWDTPEKKATAIRSLRRRGYQPRPLRRIYIPKKHGKRRPLGIPTMHDRAMQALHLLALAPIAETTADPNSYGFRSERAPADAIGQCFVALAKRKAPTWILEGDIRSCFDRISHDWLLAHVPMDKAILQKWLKAGYMEGTTLYPTEHGTPQGGIISPVLANLALDGLERILLEHCPRRTVRGIAAKVNLVRYADDFIITGRSRELLEQTVKPLVEAFLKERGLELAPEKTRITTIEEGFDFLGQNVRKYKGILLIKPSTASQRTFLATIRATIKANMALDAEKLIRLLNPIISGWTAYHHHVVSKAVFQSMGHAIYQALWRWAKRRHANKPKRWIKEKYFRPVNGNQWVFSGDSAGRPIRLVAAGYVPIKRHVKIRAAANPYDPAWEMYFETRLGVKIASTLKGRRQLLHLWKRQNGICPCCQEPITMLTGWHNHHVIRRIDGGTDTAENRMLVHPTCHTQIHSQRLTEVKPCLERGK
ncbi:MAG TPA: group II intron reverse transcriptase/maturase [Herpetosiphon sp.]|uniref:RNA-directed DNA polymerase n=1 Tax=Herpetosiphon aurantiacus (strain ATCC 23779 / DSM 785 / 114-95) TaxID=316274 RepID=A9B272_HERA2|nr:group II intron reverse transcriptase/maturase [Herpetosiphon sp.]ABX02787.1 RNA-directed DNA polymerase [Herpetosiphon aurantiacus DSM 785]ABX07422.1 RNA-directed DNA polymerase [Herpetosiphon aurantiacus DSM 785]HBW49752.1 group II intron reverse transcriptase/maturase [Herpetosiphon sp.]